MVTYKTYNKMMSKEVQRKLDKCKWEKDQQINRNRFKQRLITDHKSSQVFITIDLIEWLIIRIFNLIW
jgi:hypothetical protein